MASDSNKGFNPVKGEGLVFSTEEYRKVGLGRARTYLWDTHVKEIVFKHLRAFTPDVKEFPDRNQAVYYRFNDANQELCHLSRPLGNQGVPASEIKKLQAGVDALLQDSIEASDAKEMVKQFSLPDPKRAPEYYRLYGSRWNPKLLILWGCTRSDEQQIAPDQIRSLPGRLPKESGFKRLMRWLIWPLLLLLLLALLLLGLSECSRKPVVGADENILSIDGQFLDVRVDPAGGCLPAVIEAEAKQPGRIKFGSLGEVKVEADETISFHGFTKAGRYEITWIPEEGSGHNKEICDIVLKDCSGGEPDLSATLWVKPNPVAVDQEVTAHISESLPGSEDPVDPIVSYEIAWQEGDLLVPVSDFSQPLTHTYTQPGQYLVTLKIRTKNGREDSDFFEVNVLPSGEALVSNKSPLVFAEPRNQDNGSFTVEIVDTGSYDPDGEIERWEIDWGDGSNGEVFEERPADVPHSYDSNGLETRFVITVTAVDNQEATGNREIVVEFEGELPPPSISVDDPKFIVKEIEELSPEDSESDSLRLRKIGQSPNPDSRGRHRVELEALPPVSDPDTSLGDVSWQIMNPEGELVHEEEGGGRIALNVLPGNYQVVAKTRTPDGDEYEGKGGLIVDGTVPGQGAAPAPGKGKAPGPNTPTTPAPGKGKAPGPNTPTTPAPGKGKAPGPNSPTTPAPGKGKAPGPNAPTTPVPGKGKERGPNTPTTPAPGKGKAPDPNSPTTPAPGKGKAPGPNTPTTPAPGKGKAPGPNTPTTPAPGKGKEPGPNTPTTPAPGKGKAPGPNTPTTPVPEKGKEPGPNTPTTPAPGKGKAPGPNTPTTPAPGKGKAPGPNTPTTPAPGKGMAPGPNPPAQETQPTQLNLQVNTKVTNWSDEDKLATVRLSVVGDGGVNQQGITDVAWTLPDGTKLTGNEVEAKLPSGNHDIIVTGKVGDTKMAIETPIKIRAGRVTPDSGE